MLSFMPISLDYITIDSIELMGLANIFLGIFGFDGPSALLIRGVRIEGNYSNFSNQASSQIIDISSVGESHVVEPNTNVTFSVFGSAFRGKIFTPTTQWLSKVKDAVTTSVIHNLLQNVQISIEDVKVEVFDETRNVTVKLCLDHLNAKTFPTFETRSTISVSTNIVVGYLSTIAELKDPINKNTFSVTGQVGQVTFGLDHRSSCTPSTVISFKIGNIGLTSNESDGISYSIFESTSSTEVLDVIVKLDSNEKSRKIDVKTCGWNLNMFSDSVKVAMQFLRKIEDILPFENQAIQISNDFSIKDCWMSKPWVDRYPHLISLLRPTPLKLVATERSSHLVSEELNIAISNVKIGVGSGDIGGNQPMLYIDANGLATLRNWSSHVEVDNQLHLQANYYNTKKMIYQPIFESEGLQVGVTCNRIHSLSDIKIHFRNRVEILITPRLLEVSIHLADSFRQAHAAKPTIGTVKGNLTPSASESMSVVVRNALPYDLTFIQISGQNERDNPVKLPSGSRQYLNNFKNLNSTILETIMDGYLGQKWFYDGKMRINNDGTWLEFQACQFTSQKSKEVVQLGMHTAMRKSYLQITFFSPIWVVNNTGLDLVYKQMSIDNSDSELDQPRKWECQPALLNLDTKKLRICMKTTKKQQWSEVPLTVHGRVDCFIGTSCYPIGVEIHYNCEGLTKQVILTPYFILTNLFQFTVQVREVLGPTKRNWIALEPNKPTPFWPKATRNTKHSLVFRLKEGGAETAPFLFEENSTEGRPAILTIDDDCSGLTVDLRSTSSALLICCDRLDLDHVPLVLVNDYSDAVHFQEPGRDQFELASKASRYFTWVVPENNSLALFYDGNLLDVDVFENLQGEKVLDTLDMPTIYWKTFFYGRQRILLVTDSLECATRLNERHNEEPIIFKISAMIPELGINLVSDRLSDLLYLSIDGQNSRTSHSSPGLKFEFKSGLHHHTTDLTIQNLQLDCQMDDVVFPTMVAQEPNVENCLKEQSNQHDNTEKEEQTVIKPHIRFSVSQTFSSDAKRAGGHIPKLEFELAPTLVSGELQVLLTLKNLILPRIQLNQEITMETRAEADRLNSLLSFHQRVNQMLRISGRYDFEDLRIEVPRIVTSFSAVRTNIFEDDPEDVNPWLEMLAQVAEFNDVGFNFQPFVLKRTTLSPKQITNKALHHLCVDAGKNVTQLAFGLTNIGELLTCIGRGLEGLFCDPLTPALSRRHVFRDKLNSRFRTFYSQWIGGLTGFVANMSDDVGKTIDNITGDIKSQRRRIALGRWKKDPTGKLTEAFNALIHGISGGFSGLITEPVEGAEKTGCFGCIKGSCKGLIGVITKPVSGLFNMISGVFRAAEDAIQHSTHVERKRLPRYLKRGSDVILPYDHYAAEGFALLKAVNDGQLVNSDKYITHAELNHSKPAKLVLTDKRIIIVSKDNNITWEKEWQDIDGDPKLIKENIYNKDYDIILINYKKYVRRCVIPRRSPVTNKFVFKEKINDYIELKLSKNFDQTKIIELCKKPIPILRCQS